MGTKLCSSVRTTRHLLAQRRKPRRIRQPSRSRRSRPGNRRRPRSRPRTIPGNRKRPRRQTRAKGPGSASLKISGIIWLEEIVEKIERKHRVSQDEIREILSGSSHFRFVEKGHRKGENVYSALGQTGAGRYLIVFFVRKSSGQALIVSARDMTDSERRRYEKK